MSTEIQERAGPRVGGRTMKIYFCDICNESIPLKDINSNRITIEEGKIFCQKCAPKKVKGRDRVPLAFQLALAAVAVAVVAVGFLSWMGARDLRADRDDLQTQVSALRSEVRRAQGAGSSLKDQLGKLAESFAHLADDQKTALAEIRLKVTAAEESAQVENQAVRASIGEIVSDLRNEHEPHFSALAVLQERHQALREEHAGVKASVDHLVGAVQDLRDRLNSGQPVGPGAGEPGPGIAMPEGGSGPSGEPPSADAEVDALLAKLADSDPGARYSAVVALGNYRGDKVVAALEQAIADTEDYVRVAVIRNLRKLDSKASMPMIIESLRDKDYFVRAAARDALRALSGAEMGFDPDAASGERESKVKSWEDWWSKNKDRFVKGD